MSTYYAVVGNVLLVYVLHCTTAAYLYSAFKGPQAKQDKEEKKWNDVYSAWMEDGNCGHMWTEKGDLEASALSRPVWSNRRVLSHQLKVGHCIGVDIIKVGYQSVCSPVD